MRKEILLRILVLAGIGILLVPVIRLLFVYLDIYPRAYSLEIGQYNNVVTRYVYDKDESATNILEGLADGRRKIGEVAEKDYSLDDYYASMLREYQLADEAESKQGNGNLRLKESQELGQAATSLQSSRLKPILGSRDKDIIGSLQGMKVTHKYDGTRNDLAEPPKKDEETFDNRATRENKSDESPMESVGHRRDVSELRVYPENRFYTSPIPVSSKSNGDDDLSQLKVVMSKTHYYRFEVIKLNLISKRPVNTSDLQIVVTRDNYIFPNIGGDNDSYFKYKDQTIYGSVCLGYNPPAGTYRVLIKSKSNPKWEGVAETFMLLNRRVPPLQKGFSVVNMEYTVPLRNAEVLGPSGKMGNYHELGNWLKFMDQDACWMLVCQTTA
ncbi:MAG: hypothetical protein JNM63_15715, partial [Spirochaetia bacterium]|nr:hypothetical protein [Spirochaetia bacterium]